MASAINFNTVWTSIFEPLPTSLFLERLGPKSVWVARHVGRDRGRVRNYLEGKRLPGQRASSAPDPLAP